MARSFADMIAGLASAAIPATVAGLIVLAPSPVSDGLRDLVFDAYQRVAPRERDPAVAVKVVDVDDESLRRLGQWPWPRDRLAAILDRLKELGAATVAIDLILSEPDRTSPDEIASTLPAGPERDGLLRATGNRSNDRVLAVSLGHVPSVLGLALSDDALGGLPEPKAGIAELGDPASIFVPRFRGAVPPLPQLSRAATGLGAVNWRPDRDQVIRRVPLVMSAGGRLVPSLALETLRVAQGSPSLAVRSSNASAVAAFGQQSGIEAVRAGSLVIPTDPDGTVRVHFSGDPHQRTIPAWQLLTPGLVTPEDVEGRVVLIGAGASALGDIRATPVDGSVAGIHIHAELIEQVLSGVSLVRPDYMRGLELVIVVLGCFLTSGLVRALRPFTAATAALALVGGLWGMSWLAFTHAGLLVDPVFPSGAMLATLLGATVTGHRRTERERQRIRDAFAKYVAPEIVEAIAQDPAALRLGGETKPLSILFCDLRGFTSRSESMSAESVIRFLNGMHTPLTDAVLAERGTIDKYIGDGLMAFWNAPLDVADHATRACAAALRMQDCLPMIAAALAAEVGSAAQEDDPVTLGIGLHTGMACVGNMGSALRFDYSIVGDAVNTAARLEPLTKRYGVPIVVSEEIVAAARGYAFVPLDVLKLKGQARATRIYALVGRTDELGNAFSGFLAAHDRALGAALSGRETGGWVERVGAVSPLWAERFRQTYAVWEEQARSGWANQPDDIERVA